MPISPGAPMSLTSGTPIWLSLLIGFGAVIATHLLTQYRERLKRTDEKVARWKDEAVRQLKDISDAAIAHYSDPSSVSTTLLSGHKLLAQLKRFSTLMREVSHKNSAHAKVTTELVIDLREAITSAEDFLYEARTIRPADDPLIGEIMSCEDRMRADLSAPRQPRD